MAIDLLLLRGLNVGLSHPWLDRVIPPFSDLSLWEPLFVAVAAAILLYRRREGIWVVLGAFFAFLLAEFMSSDVIKPLVGRPRPCQVVEWVRLLGSFCPKSPSFPSTHATNAFAVTTFLGLHFPRLRVALVGIALLVAFSRVYMGVHWPLDVAAGGILGVGCALSVHWILRTVGRGLGLARGENP